MSSHIRPTPLLYAGLASLLFLLCAGSARAEDAPAASPLPGTAVIGRNVPLRIATLRRVPLRPGMPIEGELLEPVYVGTQLVLPARTVVLGHVAAAEPVPRADRRNALLNGDLTPLHVPVLSFSSVRLPGGQLLPMQTVTRIRQAELIRFVPKPKQSLFARLKGMAGDRVRSETEQVTAPHKSDRLLQFVYNQLPYHPQRIWANTAFDAELQADLTVPAAPPPSYVDAPEDTLEHEAPIVKARLVEGVSSENAKNGDPVHAVLTQPAFDHEHRLLFREGAALNGVVLRAKPSRSLGRNGGLRFAFRSVQPEGATARAAQGQVTGAEGAGSANVTVDEEGGVHANPDKDRFVGPLLLAMLAVGGMDEDGGALKQGAASNGLGIVVRVVGLTAGSQPFAVGVGVYGFAKSVYRHFLAHGKPVAFPRDTALEVQLSSRR